MRLHKITLYNYIGIFNGMGLYELDIDFTKCKNDIIVIKGDNGTGKTTLSNAISPENESNSEYIPGMSGGKVISYILDDGSTLFIAYSAPVNPDGERKKTICKVHKLLPDGTKLDLNPNGNVNEGKAVIYEILGLDSGFISLSQLSSGNRGLADKKPADRKKFINSIMDSLEVYNQWYKLLSKKSSTLKAMITSINSKIDNLGNIEQIQNSIKVLQNTLGDMEDRKVLLIANISTSKEKISNINKDGNTIDIYNRLSEELNNLNTVLFCSKDIINSSVSQKSTDDCEKELFRVKTKSQSVNERLNDLQKRSTSISDDIETKRIKLESIGDIALYDSIKGRIHELEFSLEQSINIFKSIGFENYDAVSEDEYKFALFTIDKVNAVMDSIREEYSYDIIGSTLLRVDEYEREYSDDTLKELCNHKQQTEMMISSQNNLREICKNFGSIPKDCNHKDDCPFIFGMVRAHNNMLSDAEYDQLVQLNEDLNEDIEDLKNNIEDENEIIEYIKIVKNEIEYPLLSAKSILLKFNIIPLKYKKILMNGRHFDLDTSVYREYTNLIGMIKSNRNDIKALKEQLSTVSVNKNMIEMLSSDINKLTVSYNELSLQKNTFFNESQNLTNQINELEKRLELSKHILEEKEKVQGRLERRKEIESQLPKLSSDYQKAQELNQSISINMMELEDLNSNKIPEVTNEINKNQYKIVLHNDYIKEYNEYSEQYKKVETIKYYSSPTTGLQTIMMEAYMNDILIDSNKLLSLFFNGEYLLHPFIINENEFRIPCLGKGIMNDDISSMSTSQVCMISMILSFALLKKASDRFNIIKLDEIDGGLDTNNRLQFIIALRQLMQLMHYSQCVMISHNTELGMYNADIIVLRNSDPNLKLDGNIIYQFGE